MQRQKIIIAEDHEDHRYLCALACQREGFEVLEAADGRALVDLVLEQRASGNLARVALVISDIMMPDLTGLDALEALRKAGVELPFLFVSALGDEETRARAMGLRAIGIFVKPFDFIFLRRFLRETVNNHLA
ncbi:MAG: response regulator [Polyangiaceae bacterium]|jgi:DNA-binding response OmpR family regulator|nr:response regulator [Polyangiaceae bacterium]